MSLGILDLDGNTLRSLTYSLPFSGSKEFDVKVAGRPGVSLRSVNSENVFYFGRFDPDDPWTDLEADGLDLSPHEGILIIIHLRVETDRVTTDEQFSTLYLG